MNESDLTAKQLEVLEELTSQRRVILVLGGPGSGKTTVALWGARKYLALASGPVSRVLFLTFSRAAVSQIAARLPSNFAEVTDRIEIHTFHKLAFRILKSFGRYAGFGSALPTLQSPTRIKLLGRDEGQFTYDDLIPAALKILASSAQIRRLVAARWPLVICDEAQDTTEQQWQLLQALGPQKILLLADPDQMIFTFVDGVSDEWFQILAGQADKTIQLDETSHRDPSGLLPAVATSIMRRDFENASIKDAIKLGRLAILRNVEYEAHVRVLIEQIQSVRQSTVKSIGIFGHSNASVAELADALTVSGLDHVLVGIPDAQSEALSAMGTMLAFPAKLASADDVRVALALYLTSIVRGEVPDLAKALVSGANIPRPLAQAIDQLLLALSEAADLPIAEVASIAARAWLNLPFAQGRKPWRRSAGHFLRLVSPFAQRPYSVDAAEEINRILNDARVGTLLDFDYEEAGSISLMNFHQTKGREADVVIHVYRDDDFFGREREPFPKNSRLLKVSFSRARQQVIVLLPPHPHPLVAPLQFVGSEIGH